MSHQYTRLSDLLAEHRAAVDAEIKDHARRLDDEIKAYLDVHPLPQGATE